MNRETFKHNQNQSDSGIVRILIYQGSTMLVLTFLFWLTVNNTAGYSSFFGGLISLVPNFFLGARLISSKNDAKGLLRAAYIGELGKIVLTVLLFGLVFYMVRPLDALYLFLSFIIVQFSVSLELFFKNID